MKYAFIQNGVVINIIPDEDPIFPGIAITERYSADFLASCVVVDDNVNIESGHMYDKNTGIFSEPIIQYDEDDPQYEEIPSGPTLAERTAALEAAMNFMLGL